MIPNIYPGAFFAFEGIDGAGKSKQLELAVSWLKELGIEPILSKEPNKNSLWGSAIYRDLARKNDPEALHRKDPYGFQSWYAKDSKINLCTRIIPALEVGRVILCDRFRASMVYGIIGAGEEHESKQMERLMVMNQAIIGEDFIWPDYYFIFDVPAPVAMQRLAEKGRELDGFEKGEVLPGVRRNYINFSMSYPNCKIISGNRPVEIVMNDVKLLIIEVLRRKRILNGQSEVSHESVPGL